MRKRTLGAVLLAGLALSGAGAFTASNTLPASGTAGYGTSSVSGATVNSVSYAPSSTDATKLSSVTFNATSDVTGMTAMLTVLDSSNAVLGASPYSCTITGIYVASVGGQTITCSTTTNAPNIADVASIGLTVTK